MAVKTTYDNLEYHLRQYENVYRSTEMMVDWLEDIGGVLERGKRQYICDMACGCGANIAYMAKKYPQSEFVGIELEERLVAEGKKQLQLPNTDIVQGDWFKLDMSYKDKFDGIISFQTLGWLPEYETPLKCLADLNPQWIAISSLFFEGDIDYFITVKDYTEDELNYKEMQYNIYSLVRVRKLLYNLGYKKFQFTPYDIDIDIDPVNKHGRGTYTRKMADGKRIQISGGMMMPWYFIVASK